jgi:hypothetical protein
MKLVIVCPRCGNEYRKPVVPAGELADAREDRDNLAQWIEQNVAGSQVMRRKDKPWIVVT